MKKMLTLTLLCCFLSIGFALAQAQSVKGTVVDEGGEPIIGATVLLKNTTKGVLTDINGVFTIEVPNDNSILVFSFVGYEKQEVKATPGMKVIMKDTSMQLSEVVVTGMVTMDKRLFTGATDKLGGEDVKLDGMADIGRALEGRSAGVSVQNISGTFGTAPKIRVRGATSIYGSSQPLWVVDGVIMEDMVDIDADNLSSGDAVTLISSAIAGLNADDIESFQILKDGSATSIYGARAMAGVIVVTTKKGKAGVNRISYTGEFTTRMKPNYRNFNIMNSQEQMGVYRELKQKGWLNFAETFRARNSGVYGKMYELINTYDPISQTYALDHTTNAMNGYLREAEMRNTDWFDELFNVNVMHNHSVSVSSGSDKSTTYASLSVMVDPGWYKQSQTKRYTGNLNTTYKILDNLSINLITNASYRKQKAPGTLSQDYDAVSGEVKRDFDINPYSYALNSGRVLDKNAYYISNYAPFNISNELNSNYIDLDVVDLRFQGELKWKVHPALEFAVLGAFKYKITSQAHKILDQANQAMSYRAMDDATIRERNPLLYKDPDAIGDLGVSVLPEGGIYYKDERKMSGYDFRASATWNKTFNNKHITNFYGGMEVNSFDRNRSHFTGWGLQYSKGEIPFYVYEFFKKGIEEGKDYYSIEAKRNRQAAFFGMASYSYEGKYTLSGTLRYEGSNRLGKSKSSRWLPTWNVAAAWNAHEEDFFENFNSVLSHFTLKASYSLTADNPANSITNSKIIIQSYKPNRPFADVIENGLQIIDQENSELTYEKKNEFNLGVDMGFLNNRINVVFDWFTRKNYDLIGIVNTLGTGIGINQFANAADMNSHGVELTLSTRNIARKDFSWNTDFTFAHVKTKVTNLKTRTNAFSLITGTGFTMEGYPNRGLFSYRFGGLDKNGMPTLKDEEGNIIEPKDLDFQQRENLEFLKYEGSTDPTITGGLGNVFNYKNFRLNVFLTYSFGNKVRLDPVFKSEYDDLTAMPKEFKNRWTLPGDEAYTHIPAILHTRQVENDSDLKKLYNAYNYTDVRIADGGFIRMKEISLTYDFPKSLLGKTINNLSLKLQATNLFLIYSDSKLNGQDPEFFRSGGVSAPVPKQFTMTLRVGF